MYMPNDIKGDLTAITEKTVFFTVVGVIGDIKLHDLTEGSKIGRRLLLSDGPGRLVRA